MPCIDKFSMDLCNNIEFYRDVLILFESNKWNPGLVDF